MELETAKIIDLKKSLLSEAGKKGGSSPKHYWTEEEKNIIRREYDGHNVTAVLIASKLGVTFNSVKGQVQKLGLAMDKSRRWSNSEIEILTEMITQYAPIIIAKRLYRSVNSVVIKSKRLGLSRRNRDGWFTKQEVCEILGVDHKKIQRYIDNGALKASWHTQLSPQQKGMSMWHIATEDLREFIKEYVADFQGRNVDLRMITWLINGDI